MKRSLFALSLIVACLLVWPAHAEHPTYEGLLMQLKSDAGCIPSDYPDFILFACREKMALWYFTKPNHPAHPGVIERALVQRGDHLYSHLSGYSFASDAAQPAFKTWLAQIADLDRQMKDRLAKEKH